MRLLHAIISYNAQLFDIIEILFYNLLITR
jgi:hypothetical protein